MAKRDRSALPPAPTGIDLVEAISDAIVLLRPIDDPTEFAMGFIEVCIRLGLNQGGNIMDAGTWMPDGEHDRMRILAMLEDRRAYETVAIMRSMIGEPVESPIMQQFRPIPELVKIANKEWPTALRTAYDWLKRLERDEPQRHAQITKLMGKKRRHVLVAAFCEKFSHATTIIAATLRSRAAQR